MSGLLAACSGGAGADPAGTGSTPQEGDAFPVTIEHVHGSTRIESAPLRVATVSGVNEDVVLALGRVPVGVPRVFRGADAHGSYPWTTRALESLGAAWGSDAAPVQYSELDGIDLQAVAAVEPDLIVGVHSGMSAEEYMQLSRIAPTLAHPRDAAPFATPWETTTRVIGRALGMAGQAEELISSTRAAVEAAAQQHPELAGRSFVATVLDAEHRTVSLYTEADNRSRFLAGLGMTMASAAARAEAPTPGAYVVDLPAENAEELAADLLWAWVGDDADARAVADDELLSRIPAVAAGTALFVTEATTAMSLSAASPLSLPWSCEHHVPEIADAVAATLAAAAAAAQGSADPSSDDGSSDDGAAREP